MVGVSGFVVVADVARGAVCGRAGIPAIDVACCAGNRRMHTGKGELCECPMVEMSVVPGCRRMTNGTVVRETGLHVVRVVGCDELLGVTTVAIGGRPFITAPGMTRCAIQRGMHAR